MASTINGKLAGKVILLTGGTDGIGKAAATDLARRGASLTLIGRNKQKTEGVVAELKSSTGNENVDYLLCDLSNLSDVWRTARAFTTNHDRLDVLVNNAGAMFPKSVLGPDGYELTFTLNHLAPFMLTTTLLPLIRATPNARVVTTSSAMEGMGFFDPKTTPTDTNQSLARLYGTSKLANILFTKELQRRLNDTSVRANCFHPGIVRSQFGAFGADFGWLINSVYWLSLPFSRTPEEGADTLLWLATSQEAESLA
ncbi:hypothetical protein HK405_005649, partial [Cladochytrium tenue]